MLMYVLTSTCSVPAVYMHGLWQVIVTLTGALSAEFLALTLLMTSSHHNLIACQLGMLLRWVILLFICSQLIFKYIIEEVLIYKLFLINSKYLNLNPIQRILTAFNRGCYFLFEIFQHILKKSFLVCLQLFSHKVTGSFFVSLPGYLNTIIELA